MPADILQAYAGVNNPPQLIVVPLRDEPREKVVYRILPLGKHHDHLAYNQSLNNVVSAALERIFLIKDAAAPNGCRRPVQAVPGAYGANIDLRRYLDRLSRHLGQRTCPISHEEFCETYRGGKRLMYIREAETLKLYPIERKDANVNYFMKAQAQMPGKAPRGISPRSPRYNIELGCYIKPIEHDIYRAIDKVYGDPTVACGMNAFDLGELAKSKWDGMNDPVLVEIDASHFEQHVGRQALQFEHTVYQRVYKNDKLLRRLLSWQTNLKGYANVRDGFLKWAIDAMRCSGDVTTGVGNKIIMCGLVYAFMRSIGAKPCMLNQGDDCCLFVERHLLQLVLNRCQPFFAAFGFDVRVDGVRDHLEEMVFCQMSPVFDGIRWVMCRNPTTACTKDLLMFRDLSTEKKWDEMRASVADCGLALAGHLPVMGAFYDCLKRGAENASTHKTALGMEWWAKGLKRSGRTRVTDAARVSFYASFDITPAEQVALETFYDNYVPCFTPPQVHEVSYPPETLQILQ
mgnify:FL=1